jgi:hypothetical protein
MTPTSPEEIIKQQDEIIGRLTRQNEYMSDSQSRRNEWLRQAKKDAGFPDSISFDIVWAKALNALKDSPLRDARSQAIAFADNLRDYERESHNLIGFDERTTDELYDIFISPPQQTEKQ